MIRVESSFPSIEAEGNCRERERETYVYGKIRFFMVDLFQPGDRRGSAVNEQSDGRRSGASAFEADENKDPEATGVPLAVFASLG